LQSRLADSLSKSPVIPGIFNGWRAYRASNLSLAYDGCWKFVLNREQNCENYMEEKIETDLPIHVEEVNESEQIPRRKARGRMLVLVSVIAIGVISLSKLVLSAAGSKLDDWSTCIQGVDKSISDCLMGLLCIWLAWRPTKWLSRGKVGVAFLLALSFLLPGFIEALAILYTRSFREYGFIFVGIAIWFSSLLTLQIVGLNFAGCFCRLQLVAPDELPRTRRLTIRSYFLLSFFLSIPLTIEFWFRRSQLTNSSSFSVDSSTVHYWFGGLVCDILLYIVMAMMFAVQRTKQIPLVGGLLIVLLLRGAASWSLQKSYFTDADLSDPTFLSSYHEVLTIGAIAFFGELVLIPFGLWLIQSAGYDLRIVNSTEMRRPELDGPHPLE
jgi:hypothetical protein